MSKKALLIGINYIKDASARLNGCINDVNNMSDVLVDAYGYSLTDIIKLRDDSSNPAQFPTRVNILRNLQSLIASSANYSELWIHYSGHGSQMRDTNGDEADGLDEVIVPVDFRTAGFISDDEIFAIIQNTKCKTMLVFDSCHSGTICDLQWQFDWQSGKIQKSLNGNKKISNMNVVCFSGCRDPQTSADAYDNDSKMGVGAFTYSMIACLRARDHNVDILTLYQDICKYINGCGFTQTPNLSSSAVVPTYKFVRVGPSVVANTKVSASATASASIATKDIGVIPPVQTTTPIHSILESVKEQQQSQAHVLNVSDTSVTSSVFSFVPPSQKKSQPSIKMRFL